MFHDSLNVSGSVTPNYFSRILPRAVHNWIGMVDGVLSGQILSCETHIFIISLCHAWVSISLCNEGKDTVSILQILAVWAYILECLQQSHKRQLMYIIYSTYFSPWNCIYPCPWWTATSPLAQPLTAINQHLLFCYYFSGEPLDLKSSPQYIFSFPPSFSPNHLVQSIYSVKHNKQM